MKDDVAVTFSVDMNQELVEESLYITGASIDGWDGTSVQMIDDNGDGVYEVTVDLSEGIHEYKFNNGGWDGTENLDAIEDAQCTITTDGFTNRVIVFDTTVSEVQAGTGERNNDGLFSVRAVYRPSLPYRGRLEQRGQRYKT